MSRIDTEQPMREALVDVVDFINKMDEDTAPAIRADFAYGYSDSFSLSSGESKTVTIPFNKTFSEVPQVFLTVMCNSDSGLFMCHLMYATTTQAVVSIKNGSSTAATNVTIDYLALAGR